MELSRRTVSLLCAPGEPPTPLPPTRRPRRPNGLGCVRCSVGVDGVASPVNPHGRRYPPAAKAEGRDSDVSAAVWGWVVRCLPKAPNGRPYRPAAVAGPEGPGCIRRCVGLGGAVSPQSPQGASLSPVAQAGPQGLGCMRRFLRMGGAVSPQNPHGASLSPRGPGRTGRTRVYPPLCGGGWCGVSSEPPQDVPIPARPGHDRRDWVFFFPSDTGEFGHQGRQCTQAATACRYVQ